MHSITATSNTVALSKEEQAFFAKLGMRITHLRKEHGITQVQLAETLGVSQQTITAYETGRRRIQVSALPAIAKVLRVSVEDLIGEPRKAAKRGPTGKLQQQMEEVSRLPRAKQQFVMQMLDTVLQQQAN